MLFSKSGPELLIQISNLFSAQQSELLFNYNSFKLFQRLLGMFIIYLNILYLLGNGFLWKYLFLLDYNNFKLITND